MFSIERKSMKLSEDDVSCNMVFAGPPDTAKTTLARLFAKKLADLGVIPRGIAERGDKRRSQISPHRLLTISRSSAKIPQRYSAPCRDARHDRRTDIPRQFSLSYLINSLYRRLIMNKFYESVNEINSCITNSDAAGLRDALSELWDLRDRESADSAKIFFPYIFNTLFLEHRELLDDPQLFDAWSNYYKSSGYNFALSTLSRDVFCLEYIKGKVLNSIFLGETEAALDMLKKMEKSGIKYDQATSFFENDYESVKFYYCIIDAAAEYSRPEILEYIAACAVSANSLTEQVKILQYTGFLICRLIDKEYFDILDLMYKNTFDSDLVKMTHYINIQKKLEHSCVHYIDQLLKRYGNYKRIY